jgi:hypothetical protein
MAKTKSHRDNEGSLPRQRGKPTGADDSESFLLSNMSEQTPQQQTNHFRKVDAPPALSKLKISPINDQVRTTLTTYELEPTIDVQKHLK